MVQTRRMRASRSRSRRSKQASYRRHAKKSQCKGKGPAVCRSMAGCKYASGKKRSFCRKAKGHSVRSRRQAQKRADKFLGLI